MTRPSRPCPPSPSLFHRRRRETAQAALTCLTQAVYYEAGYEPIEGAAGRGPGGAEPRPPSDLPRKASAAWVYQGADLKTGCQFSFTCDGSLTKTPGAAAWARARAVAGKALDGLRGRRTSAKRPITTPSTIMPWWAPTVTKVARGRRADLLPLAGRRSACPAAFNGRYAGNEHVGKGGAHGSPGVDWCTRCMAADDHSRRPRARDPGGRQHRLDRRWSLPPPRRSRFWPRRLSPLMLAPKLCRAEDRHSRAVKAVDPAPVLSPSRAHAAG